jgi:hypothetical protein
MDWLKILLTWFLFPRMVFTIQLVCWWTRSLSFAFTIATIRTGLISWAVFSTRRSVSWQTNATIKLLFIRAWQPSRIYRGSGYRSCQLSCIVCRECNSAWRRNRKLIFIAFHCVYTVILGARITIRTTIEPKDWSHVTRTVELTNAQDHHLNVHLNAAQAGISF